MDPRVIRESRDPLGSQGSLPPNLDREASMVCPGSEGPLGPKEHGQSSSRDLQVREDALVLQAEKDRKETMACVNAPS